VLPRLIDYSAKVIYNFDETGLFYNALSCKTLAVKSDPCTDGQRSKQRFIVLGGANSDGSDKVRLLIIGKSKTPRCFRVFSRRLRLQPKSVDAGSFVKEYDGEIQFSDEERRETS